jgi:alpha-N-arabinofuranosidase
MIFDYSHLRTTFYRVAGKSNWIKVDKRLVAQGTDRTSRLQITSKKKGVVWFDQVSLMPADTYKVYSIFVLDLDIEIHKPH